VLAKGEIKTEGQPDRHRRLGFGVEAVEKAGGKVTLLAPGRGCGRISERDCERPQGRLHQLRSFPAPPTGERSGGACP
jgi:hypothetical protein